MASKKEVLAEYIGRDIKQHTRRKFTSEEKIRIVLEGPKGADARADLCPREGIHPSMYYQGSKHFPEAAKRRAAILIAAPVSFTPSVPVLIQRTHAGESGVDAEIRQDPFHEGKPYGDQEEEGQNGFYSFTFGAVCRLFVHVSTLVRRFNLLRIPLYHTDHASSKNCVSAPLRA